MNPEMSSIGLILEGISATTTPMVICSLSSNYEDIRIAVVNAAYCELLGYSLEELSGSLAKLVSGPDTDTSAWAEYGRAALIGGLFEGNHQGYIYTKGGQRKLIQWDAALIGMHGGRPTHSFVLIREVP